MASTPAMPVYCINSIVDTLHPVSPRLRLIVLHFHQPGLILFQRLLSKNQFPIKGIVDLIILILNAMKAIFDKILVYSFMLAAGAFLIVLGVELFRVY